MGEFRVHHCRFFEYKPQAIHCLAYCEDKDKLALSRADGNIEIWSIADDWYHENTIEGVEGRSVEALVWYRDGLFSGGLDGNVVEHDLFTMTVKAAVSSNSGAIWCMTLKESESLLAAGTEDGCVTLYEITSDGFHYHRGLDRQEGRILSIAWYVPEDLIITGGMDNIRVWSVASGHAIQRITLGRQENNKETIVWALAVTRDFTIISGDSRGKTCFWNGNHGTCITEIQSHVADVLSLCVNKEGNCVYSSGVDPTLVQFDYVPMRANSDWKQWVMGDRRHQHSHDVRAITMAGSRVVSAGVDCQLAINDLEAGGRKKPSMSRIGPVPQVPLVTTVSDRDLLLLRYSDTLEIWKLGSTDKNSDKDGEVLPLRSNPIKLLELRAREGERIIACDITRDGDWLAFSERSRLRIFKTCIQTTEIGTPKINISRVKPMADGILPARCIAFSPEGRHIACATCQGTIQVLSYGDHGVTLLQTLHRPNHVADITQPIHLLSVSPNGKLLSVASLDNSVLVFHLHTGIMECSLPCFPSKPTALSFSPTSAELLVAYSTKKIIEFKMASREYSDWSRKLRESPCLAAIKGLAKITRIWYNPKAPHQIFFHTDQHFCILDKSKPLPKSSREEKRARRKSGNPDSSEPKNEALKICTRYKYLMHMDSLADDYLVAVERTPVAIMDTLPPTLRQKKFGT